MSYGGGNTTSISYTSNALVLGQTYILIFSINPNGTDPNYQPYDVGEGQNMFAFTTTCLE